MKLYFYNITGFSNAQFSKWFEDMSPERKESVLRLKIPKKQKASIAADHLRRSAVSDFCGVSPDSIVFDKNKYGKPFVVDLPVYFSISHSADMVVCAVSEEEIGIDIEKVRKISLRVAERFATDEEFNYISNSENGFFEIWTLKEAYFKCIGTGLGSDIKSVSFKIDETDIKCSENGFKLSFHKICDDYICSVCQKYTE